MGGVAIMKPGGPVVMKSKLPEIPFFKGKGKAGPPSLPGSGLLVPSLGPPGRGIGGLGALGGLGKLPTPGGGPL